MSSDTSPAKKTNRSMIITFIVGAIILGLGTILTIRNKVISSIEEMVQSNPLYAISYKDINYGVFSKELEITELSYSDKVDNATSTTVKSIKVQNINLAAFDKKKGNVVIASKAEAKDIVVLDSKNNTTMSIASYVLTEPIDNIGQIIEAQEHGIESEEFWQSVRDMGYANLLIEDIAIKEANNNWTIQSIDSQKLNIDNFDLSMKGIYANILNGEEEAHVAIEELNFDDVMMPDAQFFAIAYRASLDEENFDEDAFMNQLVETLRKNTPFKSITFKGSTIHDKETLIFKLEELKTNLDTTRYAFGLHVNGFELSDEMLSYWLTLAELNDFDQVTPFDVNENSPETMDVSFGFDFIPHEDITTVDTDIYLGLEHLFDVSLDSQLILSKKVNELNLDRLDAELIRSHLKGMNFIFKDKGIIAYSALAAQELYGENLEAVKARFLNEIEAIEQDPLVAAYADIFASLEEMILYPEGEFKLSLPEKETSFDELALKILLLPQNLGYTVSYMKGEKTLEEAVNEIEAARK